MLYVDCKAFIAASRIFKFLSDSAIETNLVFNFLSFWALVKSACSSFDRNVVINPPENKVVLAITKIKYFIFSRNFYPKT